MTPPWWTGIPRAQATLACADELHHLVWEEGRLTAPDHADPEGERALAALGGEPLACISMLDAWLERVADPEVLLLGSRGPIDTIAVPDQRPGVTRPAPAVGMGSAGFGGGQAVSLASRPRQVAQLGAGRPTSPDELLSELLSLGGGLPRRLDATVAAHWLQLLVAGDERADQLRARLHAALYGRVLATLVAWLGEPQLELDLELGPEGGAVTLARSAAGEIVGVLPFGWLVGVWARGLETVWGRFCLAADTVDGHVWELTTVGPELGEPSTIRLEFLGAR